MNASNNTNFVFFGTDQFAVKVLNTLKNRKLIPGLIVTRPDRPVGRKQILTQPPTKIWGTINNVEVVQPETLADFATVLAGLGKQAADFSFFVVASYGKIIPQKVIDLPKLGILNIHPSLLPKYRGASPLEYTILNGDTETGVAIMQMDAEMDHGPILKISNLQLPEPDEITYPSLRDVLAELGANTLADIVPDFLESKITPTNQDHSAATYTKLIKKEDGEIDPFGDQLTAWRKYRAFIDWPGVWFMKDGKRIIVKKARFENKQFVIERILPEGGIEKDWVNP